MSSVILCHSKKAKNPYYLKYINLNIYTIEELCFYIYNNIYILNKSLLNQELCMWINKELNLKDLSNMLLKIIKKGSLTKFVLTIIEYVGFCDSNELNKINRELVSLKNVKSIDIGKNKADNLFKNGKYESAILEYEKIIQNKKSNEKDYEFYSKIYNNLGVSYAKLFLFQEASEKFEEAYKLSKKESIFKLYLLSSYMYLNENDYNMIVTFNNATEISEKLLKEYKNIKNQFVFLKKQENVTDNILKNKLEDLKYEYKNNIK